MLVATHDLELACRACGRALVLRAGELAAELPLDGPGSAARLLETMEPGGFGPGR